MSNGTGYRNLIVSTTALERDYLKICLASTEKQIKLLKLAHCSLYASYTTSCTSSCRAMEQQSHYPVPVLAGYAGGYPATSGSGRISKNLNPVHL